MDTTKKTLYKVLNKDLTSPFQGFQYEIGKEYVCEDFDTSHEVCSRGFYATELEGIIYSWVNDGSKGVFEVEVGGESKEFDLYKNRYEKQTIVREIPKEELEGKLKELQKEISYNVYDIYSATNMLVGEPKEVTEEVKQLLKEWASVRDSSRDSIGASVVGSVRASVRGSVWDSVWSSVGKSVWYSVGKSVWYSVRGSVLAFSAAVVSSYFPEVTFEGDFSSALKLWERGFIAVKEGSTWRLLSGKDRKEIFSISVEDLKIL